MNIKFCMNSVYCLFLMTVVFITSACTNDLFAQNLFPVDESYRDSSFLKFKTDLIQAVKLRDSIFLRAVIDEEIKAGFGGESGISNFWNMWQPQKPDVDFWKILEDLLSLGGSFYEDDFFIAPYVFSKWNDEYDAFLYYAVTDSIAVLWSSPDSSSGAADTLSYNIVKMIEKLPEWNGFANVFTTDGKAGFIDEAVIRSPIDFRIGFKKKREYWKIVFLVAGD